MIRRIIYICLTISLFTTSSCDLTDDSIINDTLRDVTAVELLKGNIGQVVFNQSAMTGWTVGSLMQYLKQGDSSIQTFKNYTFNSISFNALWNNGFYTGSLVNLQEMKLLAAAESNNNLEAIANILLAHEFGALTNLFGDIPMSEALLKDENLTPKYDTQEEVYENILSLLEDAIAQIGNGSIDSSLSGFDTIYNGNMQGWKQLAYGLKARYLLNLSKKNPALFSEILDIVTTKSFTSTNDQANFKYDLSFQNPLFRFGIERPNTLFIGDFFRDELLSDPRMPSFTKNDEGLYLFVGDNNFTWIQADATTPLLSFTEIKFMEAEVLLLMGSSVDNISVVLAEAMTSNFEITSGLTQDAIQYISDRSNLSIVPINERHERIMHEAYKAYYGYSHLQTWNNYRRTGFPVLSSTANFPSDGNPSNIVPRRLPYPISEFELNPVNLNDAIARQNGVRLDDDMWLYE